MKPQAVNTSRASAETCPACGCRLDARTDSGCPYCGWHEGSGPASQLRAVAALQFAPKGPSPWVIWGERLLTSFTFAVVAFATFSLLVTLFRLLAGFFAHAR